MHPSGASGINFEVSLGPAQHMLRALEASVHGREFKLRALAIWSQRLQILCSGRHLRVGASG
eukprot:1384119-Alexandrium_andersonii.AAC.1